MTEVDKPGNGNSGVGAHFSRLLLMLAVLLAIAALVAAALVLKDKVSPVLLVAGGLFSAMGLMALLGWISGLLGFSGSGSERPFFDALTDAMGDAAVVTDNKGRAIYANSTFLKLVSKSSAARLVGLDVLYAGYPDFSAPVYQLGQAAAAGEILQRDVRVAAGSSVPGASPDEARWLRLSVAPLRNNRQQGQTLWRLTDITADRRHQEQAFARLQFIITYLDRAPAGFFSTLPDGKVDYVNATLADWLGVDLADVQRGALNVSELVGEEAARQLAAVAPMPSGSRIETFPVTLATKAGATIAADLMHRADFDAAGEPLPSRSMVVRRGQLPPGSSALVKEGDAIRMLSAAAPIGVAQLSDSGVVMAANSGFLALSPKIKFQAKLSQAFTKGHAEGLEASLKLAARTPGKRVETEVQFDNVQPRAVQLSLVQFENMPGITLAFAEDKTESKTLEVQLAQSQKMQAVGQLASGIAHDFNNVLTPIIGFADLLLAKMRPTDSAFNDVMNIKQNANRAANLVRQLLAFSRKQTMQPKLHTLTEAMSDLGNLLGRVLGEKVELNISHGRDLGYVMVDIHQFEQVIINLAVNARDAMPGGGKLFVKTFNLPADKVATVGHPLPSVEYVVCEVRDTGTGIPKDILEKIWEPFFSTKDVGKGTGLGLSMVYGIIKQTGGYIYCDSEMGKGTTFSIFLPRHYPEKSAPVAVGVTEKPEAEAKRQDFTGRGRILVVEDEDSVRAFALRALESRGYTVVEADSGESAIEIIEKDKDGFELILSDVVMPEMDGPTMLSEIRKRGLSTKVIFMSGYAEDAFERNLENPDDFAFLQKPFSLKQLIEKVKEVMS